MTTTGAPGLPGSLPSTSGAGPRELDAPSRPCPGAATDAPCSVSSQAASGREAEAAPGGPRGWLGRLRLHARGPGRPSPQPFRSNRSPSAQGTRGTRGPGAPGTATPEASSGFQSSPRAARRCRQGACGTGPDTGPLRACPLDAGRKAAPPPRAGDPTRAGV